MLCHDGGVTIPEVPGSPERQPLGTHLFRVVMTAIVDFGLLVVGMWLGFGPTPAKTISWVFGTLTAYAINARWAVQSPGSRGRPAAVGILTLTFALQVGTFAALFPPLQAAWGTTIAQVAGFVVAHGMATLVNVVVRRVWSAT